MTGGCARDVASTFAVPYAAFISMIILCRRSLSPRKEINICILFYFFVKKELVFSAC